MSRLSLLLCLFGLTYSQGSADLSAEAIIGGDYAKEDQFKYQISLQYQEKNICGGSIINDYYILTAAHCVTYDNGQIRILPFNVIAGTKNLQEKKQGIVVPVEIIYVHKKYDWQTFENDIAILKLERGLNLRDNSKIIEKINLAKSFENFDDVIADVAGFGYQSVNVTQDDKGQWQLHGASDGKLKHAKVLVISYDKCVAMNDPQPIFKTNICGQVLQRKIQNFEGLCFGDSGSPLVYDGEVIGVASLSPVTCDESKVAAIYTRVSSYWNLIKKVISGKPGSDVVSASVPH